MLRVRGQRKGKRQRFYARNAVETMSHGDPRVVMRLLSASCRPTETARHPALQSFADECSALLFNLVMYMGGLGLLVTMAVVLFNAARLEAGHDKVTRADWALSARSYPAFAVSQFDSPGKTETYEIFRHPGGGRRDVLRWAVAGEKPVVELEIYRPGAEAGQMMPPAADIAGRMDPDGVREIAGEGIIDSKFGPVALLGFADRADDAHRCLGFMKTLEQANLRISGWSCQGETLPARRAAIACMLNRLTLLTAGNDPRLAELFARAELKRGSCLSGSAAATAAADWVTGAQNPRLRGSF